MLEWRGIGSTHQERGEMVWGIVWGGREGGFGGERQIFIPSMRIVYPEGKMMSCESACPMLSGQHKDEEHGS
jgi:hypothetical protein